MSRAYHRYQLKCYGLDMILFYHSANVIYTNKNVVLALKIKNNVDKWFHKNLALETVSINRKRNKLFTLG